MLNNIYYINLEHRKDRKEHVESELNKMGWSNYNRFNAIKHIDGRVGCSMSHLSILKLAKEQNLEYVVIIEDDILFTRPDWFNNKLNELLNKNIEWDVLLLASNLLVVNKEEDFIYNVKRGATTTGYIVKNHYFDKLINNIQTGIDNLIKYPEKHNQYAIDTNWFKLQEKDKWFIIIPRTITQKEDYSDIESMNVNYENLMLDV